MNGRAEPALVLAASPRDWGTRVHRHVADHGGARVRATLLTAADTLAEQFDVLVADDRTSFLSARLIAELHRAGRGVLGLYDPEDPEAKADLHDWGVDHALPCTAPAEEIVNAACAVAGSGPKAPPPPRAPARDSHGWVVTVSGPGGGAGRTELALTLALALADREPTVLLETDEQAASLAPRLGLAPYPNLRLALELERQEHGRGALALQALRDSLRVLVAGPMPAPLPAAAGDELTALVAALASPPGWVVIDTARPAVWLGSAQSTVMVGAATPVGVLRASTWLRQYGPFDPAPHVVLNHAPSSTFRNWEAVEELGRVQLLASVTRLPQDERVGAAVWRGMPVNRGRFARGVGTLAERLRAERAAARKVPR